MRSKTVQHVVPMLLAAALAWPSIANASPVEVVALGDSDTAGFLVGRRNAFPVPIGASLRETGYDVEVTNRGISGDTTGGMLRRLDRAVPQGTQVAIVQGGYNDGRRGISARARDANIEAILERLRKRGVRTILCGYSGARWAGLARRQSAVLVSSTTCYDGTKLTFDGLHMSRAGHRVVASRLASVVQRLLARR